MIAGRPGRIVDVVSPAACFGKPGTAKHTRPRTAPGVGSCFGNQRETAVYLRRHIMMSGPAAG